MPKVYVPQDGSRPPEVEAAVQVIGNSARLEILRFVAEHPDSFFGQIHDALPGLASSSLVNHLRALVELNVLVTDLPPEVRKGRSPRYALERDRLRALTDAWYGYITGGKPSNDPAGD